MIKKVAVIPIRAHPHVTIQLGSTVVCGLPYECKGCHPDMSDTRLETPEG